MARLNCGPGHASVAGLSTLTTPTQPRTLQTSARAAGGRGTDQRSAICRRGQSRAAFG